MITRRIEDRIIELLSRFPVVGVVGARQVGKTTLAKAIAMRLGAASVYLDLERPSDLAKLSDPELYLRTNEAKLVILDEIQRRPDLFPVLRSLADEGERNGRFLVLGSASPSLTRQASESLAGRVVYDELSPFSFDELGASENVVLPLWSRGGFPRSYLATSEAASSEWREAFMRTYLERDIPSLGIRVSATTLGRFWQMIAHLHGQLWNASKIAAALGVSAPTVKGYLDLLQDTFVLRQLQPYFPNAKKRLIKSPKVYLRDSGILHALLRVTSLDDLFGHPCAGASWEGWVIEQILSLAPPNWRPWFYRTSAGAEIDLLLERTGARPPLAFEIKLSTEPSVSRGFWSALSDLGLGKGYVVCMAREEFPIGKNAVALPVTALPRLLRKIDEA